MKKAQSSLLEWKRKKLVLNFSGMENILSTFYTPYMFLNKLCSIISFNNDPSSWHLWLLTYPGTRTPITHALVAREEPKVHKANPLLYVLPSVVLWTIKSCLDLRQFCVVKLQRSQRCGFTSKTFSLNVKGFFTTVYTTHHGSASGNKLLLW
jgi:hypothetical protein